MPLRREPSREHELPVESSWRMVEGGENDSFDTSIVPELDFEDDIPLSSGPSQGNFSLASQDSAHSISDFVDRADDERVILRTPFRPSIPTTRQPSNDVHRTPEPEFYMPSIHMESPSQGRSSSGRSSRTIRPTMDEKERIAMRLRNQRQQSGYGSLLRKRNNNSSSSNDARFGGREAQRQPTDRQQQTVGRRVMDSAPHALLDVLAWVADIVGMALRMLKLPLAMMFAVWLMIGATIILRNMVTQSITTSLSPICKIPGVGALSLPFCPQFGVTPAGSDEQLSAPGGQSVEFDDLHERPGELRAGARAQRRRRLAAHGDEALRVRRDRVAEPGLARSAIGPGPGLGDRGAIPLSVHIETIDRGVDRLEEARRRIRDAEDDKVREALARGGVKDEARAIDA
ncbi:conserved hypothetical protein [Verticillium alfalfae VaMs.102]|uniref:Uncharacterized protein n=1 Tax=Verticillium alfalfae (strain VaMs.102 / ATCC MYA-4576 / FGSC 10136) TaxID=526221 RepID=C9SGZ6_VERA1|nr:conserved hypothetical protein [Verticillium alfalfae VaMs.102]EEY17590.1 conserved hypothetical protein [Verticillium alfalfae VaMs.102]